MTISPPRPSEALALHTETIRTVLPNGLTVLVRRDRSAPVVSIVTHVKAGYFDETDDQVGIAHVLEHMYFKGTPTRGVGEIARETKANGGYLNAHTIYDHTSYYTVLPSSSFVAGLEIQFDAYARSVIDAGELARELEVIIQEVKRKRDTASAVTIESLYALLYDHHRIRRWRMGEEDALRTFSRDQLVGFYRHWYQPGNTILSVVGDVDPDVVLREVMARHGQLAAGAPPRPAGPQETVLPGLRHREWAGDIAQQQIAFGWRVPALTHDDAPALDLAGVVLGTGRASRLYRAVRERQLASSVSAWNYTSGDVGVFVAHAESPSDQARDAARAVWRELQAARTDGLRAEEVARAQRILEARWLRRLESMDGQAQYLASWEADGGLAVASQYYDTLLSLDARAVQEAMQRHLAPEQVSMVSYRPDGSEAVAENVEALRSMLAVQAAMGSEVLSTPAAPVVTPAQEVLVSATAPSEMQGDVWVSRTATGVPILVVPKPGAPLVHFGVFLRGGAVLDAPQREGLARLTAQSMLKGTATRSGAQIAEAAESLGSSIGVSAGLESVGWSMSVPTRHVPVALELLGDVVQHPAFPVDGVETERALALAEVARVRDDMYRWPMRLAVTAAYGEHPYARSVIGSETSLAALGRDDVVTWHARHVLRAPTVIAVVGDVDPEEVAALCRTHFHALHQVDDSPLPVLPWPVGRVAARDSRAKQQSALALLFPGPGRNDPARYAARVLSAIASGLGGRFFEQLRDVQSLAYTVSAFPVERRAGGAFAAYIATSPEREDEAREGLMREFAKFRDAEPSEEELTRARNYLIGTQAIAQQSGGTVLGDLVDAWLFGEGLHERHEETARLAAVTGADVLQLAQRYLQPGLEAEGLVQGTGRAP
ncbi:MAG TPA: pitrilysin family protein [Gemmatimonas sp.]|uniref:M16 family metallopeptidase n=1 Tax=Gemmatimonas sp. TaxID=1962908 RepID=UPI002ED916AE